MTTRRLLLCCALLLAAMPLLAPAQQQPAIPVTVKGILKTPPMPGQLLQVSGYLLGGDKEPKLQDAEVGRRITLDFSGTNVTPESLGATGTISPPVMVIGRMQGTRDAGKPVVTVLGVVKLTP